MANNRLYIGDKSEKKYALIARGWGDGWKLTESGMDRLNKILTESVSDSDVGGKTNLILFTECDDLAENISDWDKIQ